MWVIEKTVGQGMEKNKKKIKQTVKQNFHKVNGEQLNQDKLNNPLSSSLSLSSLPLSPRKQTIASHFANADKYNQHASVQAQVCDLLITKIRSPHHHNLLEIGAGQGQLTQKIAQYVTADHWYINELCEEHAPQLQSIMPSANIHIGDAEQLLSLDNISPNFNIRNHPCNHHHLFNLIISANAVQWFDNPLTMIANAHNHLDHGGQLLFNTFTPNNFHQIKQLTGQGLHYPSEQQWLNELNQHDFQLLEVSTHRYTLYFSSPYQVLKHIKQTGVSVNNTDSNASFRWTKSSLQQFHQAYQDLFSSENGQVYLTYEVLLISAGKK